MSMSMAATAQTRRAGPEEGIVLCTKGGSNIQINDATNDVSVFGVRSFFVYAPQSSMVHQNFDITCNFVHDSAGVINALGPMNQTAYTPPDMTSAMFPQSVLAKGGNWNLQATNRIMLRTVASAAASTLPDSGIMELIAGNVLAMRTATLDQWVDEAATLSVGDTLTLSGYRPEGFKAAAGAVSSPTPIPVTNAYMTTMTHRFMPGTSGGSPRYTITFSDKAAFSLLMEGQGSINIGGAQATANLSTKTTTLLSSERTSILCGTDAVMMSESGITVTSSSMLTLSCGASSIVITPASITIITPELIVPGLATITGIPSPYMPLSS